MLDTDPDQIHLWLTFLDEIRDEKLLRRYRGLLAPEEQRRLGRFVFTIDQTRYLVTRALVRTVLSRYVAIEPQDWSFAENVFGRPEIANDDDRSRRIAFNISHSNSLILLGVTGNKVLGVDVENYYARKAPLDIADSLFAPEELAGLRALPDAQQCERFFEY
jgi:4'-phosphopantetheinyl transferase